MTATLHLTPLDRLYPSRLRSLARPPASLTVRGGPLEATRAVAIVGSRDASRDAAAFSHDLARSVVQCGAVVVSGGALGIDGAAHRGALDHGGPTWAVAGTGCEHCFPPEHASLFDRIAAGPGAMVWPFPPASAARAGGFVLRNRVLVALSDTVVVVQAGVRSGALRAAACAQALKKPLWVVPAPPWAAGFDGSRHLLDQGARPLTSIAAFLRTLELGDVQQSAGAASPALEVGGHEPMDPNQFAILSAISNVPIHLDEIAEKARATVPRAAAALLTLALEAVVVEGPPGFFRRRDSYKR